MKKMSKVLMKGNEAFAESCIRAGCRFFSGYPITPQTEILEYMSWRMEEVGGAFIQTESELAGVDMAFGAASAGARALATSAGPGFSVMESFSDKLKVSSRKGKGTVVTLEKYIAARERTAKQP